MENMFYFALAMTVFLLPLALYPLFAFLLYVRYRNRGGKMSLEKWMDRF